MASGGGNGGPPAAARGRWWSALWRSAGRRDKARIGYCRRSGSDQRGRHEGDAGVQSIGSAVVDVTPGDYFELIARQTSGATKNLAADELTWFAVDLVE